MSTILCDLFIIKLSVTPVLPPKNQTKGHLSTGHFQCPVSHICALGKQYWPRSNIAEYGVWSGFDRALRDSTVLSLALFVSVCGVGRNRPLVNCGVLT